MDHVASLPEPVFRGHECRLRVASFNIQTGISTRSYHGLVTGGWRHLWPSPTRLPNLFRIAQLLKPYDIVGLQEVDGGGLRSDRIIQTQYLAEQGGFPHWHNQVNRRIGHLARHSNGLLSRPKPHEIVEYPLPGVPGRGAILARYGRIAERKHGLTVLVLHLALTRKARLRQLDFVSERIQGDPHVIVMGDFNCEPDSGELRRLTQRAGLCDPACGLHTWPSWQPKRMIDHILVTPTLTVHDLQVIHFACSDHLPIAMEVELPGEVQEQMAQPHENPLNPSAC